MCTENEFASNITVFEEKQGNLEQVTYDVLVPTELSYNDQVKIYQYIKMIYAETYDFPRVVSQTISLKQFIPG